MQSPANGDVALLLDRITAHCSSITEIMDFVARLERPDLEDMFLSLFIFAKEQLHAQHQQPHSSHQGVRQHDSSAGRLRDDAGIRNSNVPTTNSSSSNVASASPANTGLPHISQTAVAPPAAAATSPPKRSAAATIASFDAFGEAHDLTQVESVDATADAAGHQLCDTVSTTFTNRTSYGSSSVISGGSSVVSGGGPIFTTTYCGGTTSSPTLRGAAAAAAAAAAPAGCPRQPTHHHIHHRHRHNNSTTRVVSPFQQRGTHESPWGGGSSVISPSTSPTTAALPSSGGGGGGGGGGMSRGMSRESLCLSPLSSEHAAAAARSPLQRRPFSVHQSPHSPFIQFGGVAGGGDSPMGEHSDTPFGTPPHFSHGVATHHISGDEFAGSMSLLHRPAVKEMSTLQKETDDEGNKVINDFQLIAELGKGQQGKVKLACRKDAPNELVAIKIVNKSILGKVSRRDGLMALKREIAIMKKLRHRNIVSLHAVVDDPTANKLYLVMDYVSNGPLLKQLSSAEKMEFGDDAPLYHAVDEKNAQRYMRQLIDGLRYLHKHAICHADLKIENILCGEHGRVYLADFGVSSFIESDDVVDENCSNNNSTTGGDVKGATECNGEAARPLSADAGAGTLGGHNARSQQGSPAYWPPEFFAAGYSGTNKKIAKIGSVAEAQDLWALGVCFFVMLYGRMPFHGDSLTALADAVQFAPLRFPTDVRVSPEAKALLELMLSKDPHKRLPLVSLRDHPFFGGSDGGRRGSGSRSTSLRGSVMVTATEEDIEGAIAVGRGINPGIRFMLLRGRRVLQSFVKRVRARIAERRAAAMAGGEEGEVEEGEVITRAASGEHGVPEHAAHVVAGGPEEAGKSEDATVDRGGGGGGGGGSISSNSCGASCLPPPPPQQQDGGRVILSELRSFYRSSGGSASSMGGVTSSASATFARQGTGQTDCSSGHGFVDEDGSRTLAAHDSSAVVAVAAVSLPGTSATDSDDSNDSSGSRGSQVVMGRGRSRGDVGVEMTKITSGLWSSPALAAGIHIPGGLGAASETGARENDVLLTKPHRSVAGAGAILARTEATEANEEDDVEDTAFALDAPPPGKRKVSQGSQILEECTALCCASDDERGCSNERDRQAHTSKEERSHGGGGGFLPDELLEGVALGAQVGELAGAPRPLPTFTIPPNARNVVAVAGGSSSSSSSGSGSGSGSGSRRKGGTVCTPAVTANTVATAATTPSSAIATPLPTPRSSSLRQVDGGFEAGGSSVPKDNSIELRNVARPRLARSTKRPSSSNNNNNNSTSSNMGNVSVNAPSTLHEQRERHVPTTTTSTTAGVGKPSTGSFRKHFWCSGRSGAAGIRSAEKASPAPVASTTKAKLAPGGVRKR